MVKLSLVSVALAAAAHGEQIVMRNVEYSNDSYADAGKVVACIVTVAVTDPPDPRVLNFQFLQFKGRVGWKITGGTIDWKNQSATAKRAADGRFSTGTFIHPTAFQKNLTPEGQLVGVLTDGGLSGSFSQAFFKSQYSVSVRWENATDDLVYYIAQSPPPAVVAKFQDCVRTLS